MSIDITFVEYFIIFTEYGQFYQTVKYQGFSNNLDGNSEKDDNWCNWQHALPIRGNNGSIP